MENFGEAYVLDEALQLVEVWRKKLATLRSVIVVNPDTDEARILCETLRRTISHKQQLISQRPGEAMPKLKSGWLCLFFHNAGLAVDDTQTDLFYHWLELAKTNPSGQLILITEARLNSIPRDSYWEVAENEYAKLGAGLGTTTWEAACRQIHQSGSNTVVMRYSNLFGPGINHTWNPICDLSRLPENSLSLSASDAILRFSVTYIGDLLFSVSQLPPQRTMEWAYNLTSHQTSRYELGVTLPILFPNLAVNLYSELATGNTKYALLQCLLLKRYLKRQPDELRTQLWKTVVSSMPDDQVAAAESAAYSQACHGKLDQVRKFQLEMLQEVQQICDKHNLRFFLGGGSQLGAIRGQGFIPWDDDIDLIMLRQDFDTFRRVAPPELSARFSYHSWRDDKQHHYGFDKIRLRETRMPTQFGFAHEMEDGVSIDIFVFDQTANNRFLRKFHTFMITTWRRAMTLKWLNKPQHGLFYAWSLPGIVLMRLLRWRFVHNLLERILKTHAGAKRAKYLVDGVGFHLNHGAIPVKWFAQTEPSRFAGTIAPIPNGYDDYMRLLYGADYMTLPPPSQRGGHQLAAVDLGPYA